MKDNFDKINVNHGLFGERNAIKFIKKIWKKIKKKPD